MVNQLIVTLALVTVAIISENYAQDYLTECVNAYEAILKFDCDHHGHLCFNDETVKVFGQHASAAAIRIAIESCETATNPAVLKSRYCCANKECFKQCKGFASRSGPLGSS